MVIMRSIHTSQCYGRRFHTPWYHSHQISQTSSQNNNNNKKKHIFTRFIGVLEAEFYEADVEVIPITYPFATSHIWWPINQANKLNIKFDFRSNRTTAVLAYGEVTTSEGNGFWEVSTHIIWFLLIYTQPYSHIFIEDKLPSTFRIHIYYTIFNASLCILLNFRSTACLRFLFVAKTKDALIRLT